MRGLIVTENLKKCSKNPLYFTKRGDIIGKLLERRSQILRLIGIQIVLSSWSCACYLTIYDVRKFFKELTASSWLLPITR